jgi:hypothetical protein
VREIMTTWTSAFDEWTTVAQEVRDLGESQPGSMRSIAPGDDAEVGRRQLRRTETKAAGRR